MILDQPQSPVVLAPLAVGPSSSLVRRVVRPAGKIGLQFRPRVPRSLFACPSQPPAWPCRTRRAPATAGQRQAWPVSCCRGRTGQRSLRSSPAARSLSSYRRPLLGTGLCGGLSTFSTVQVEILNMLGAHAWGLAAAAMNFLIWVAVALIGGAGSVARFLVDGAVSSAAGHDFPFGTMASS
jgi:fluoride ion exporter CrcB/FEX